jgi:zinc-binding alcohol dehydrogenase/oxidoreductase
MKAISLEHVDGPLRPVLTDTPEPGPGQVRLKLKAAAINHRDIWIRKGLYPTTKFPCIPGSDGAGVVETCGPGTDPALAGKAVLINPSLYWGDQRTAQDKDFQILGVPSQGTFAEYICVPASNIYEIPEGFHFANAAALPLAGLTAYRALFYRGDLKPFEKVLVTGAGGGVAGFLLTFAVKARAWVYVTSSSDKKIQYAIQRGSENGVNYTHDDWEKQLLGMVPEGFDLIVDGAGGKNFHALLRLLRGGGKIVTYGATAGPIPEISSRQVFSRQIGILGTTMGSPHDFESMLEFVTEHNVRPPISRTFDLDQAEEAFRYLENKEQFGKVLLSIDNDTSSI